MAYMDQQKKSQIAPVVKAILKEYGMKGSLSVRNHSTLCLKLKSGPLDPFADIVVRENHMGERTDVEAMRARGEVSVNPYWYHEHFSGKTREFLSKILAAMNDGNHNRSDVQKDYFDVGWYVDVDFGAWNKPYVIAQ